MMQSTFFDNAGLITLRPYQRAAIDAVYAYLRAHDDNPCVVLPTAAGKTPVIGTICRDAVVDWGGRVLVLAHVKELLQQAADNLHRVCPRVPVGVYSAGLKRKEVTKPITVAGIQSIYKMACDLDPFNVILIDEAHLIAPEGDGMYRQFLADSKVVNPELRIVGLTATPFRMKSGPICSPDGFLNTICYEIGVRELIVDGYLSPLISKGPRGVRVDTSVLHVAGGEFVSAEVDALMDREDVVSPACAEIVEDAAERRSVLVFACSVAHGLHVTDTLRGMGQDARFVSADTPPAERDKAARDFKNGALKFLVNVNVFTTGFDAPNVDLVALMRPTLSPGLYYQMVGRGFRLSPGKVDCLIKDFGGNIKRHGPVDQITVKEIGGKKGKSGEAPAKECPNCHSLIAAGFSICPDCGFEFPPPERNEHDKTASGAGILSGQVTVSTLAVNRVLYSVHAKRMDPDAPQSMRVDYLVDRDCRSEWICFEHEGFARRKAEAWWKQHSPDPVPDTAERAVEIAIAGGVADCTEITIREVSGDKFPRIIDYVLGEMPAAVEHDREPAESGGDPWEEANSYFEQSRPAADDDIPF